MSKLYLAIGLPIITNAAMFSLLFLYVNSHVASLSAQIAAQASSVNAQFVSVSAQINGLREDIRLLAQRTDDLVGAINELDKRLTRVEIKVGIQP